MNIENGCVVVVVVMRKDEENVRVGEFKKHNLPFCVQAIMI